VLDPDSDLVVFVSLVSRFRSLGIPIAAGRSRKNQSTRFVLKKFMARRKRPAGVSHISSNVATVLLPLGQSLDQRTPSAYLGNIESEESIGLQPPQAAWFFWPFVNDI